MTRTAGASAATATEMPAISPPPLTGTRMVRDVGPLLEDLEADGALPGDDVRVVERRDHGQPFVPAAIASARAPCSAERVAPARTTSPPCRRTPSTFTCRAWTRASRPRPGGRSAARREGHRLAVIAARLGDHARGRRPGRRAGRRRV